MRVVIHETVRRLNAYVEKIAHCVGQLSDDQVWWRPHESMNSIGNLILHLTGNIRQWLVSGVGGAEDVRDRPAEFSSREAIPKVALLNQLEQIVGEAKAALARASADEMLAPRRIQGFDVTGWGAVFSCVPHFEGHTQEITCLTRMQLKDAYRFHWVPQTPEEGAPPS